MMKKFAGLKALQGAVNAIKTLVRRDYRANFGIRIRADIASIDDITEDIALTVQLVLHRNRSPVDAQFEANEAGPMFVALRDGHERRPSVPKVEFLNTVSSEELEPVKVLQSNRTGAYFFIFYYDLVVRQPLLLHTYPLDRQVIKLQVQSHSAKLQKWSHPLDDSPVTITSDPTWVANEMVVSYKKLDWEIAWVAATSVRIDMSDLFELNIGVSRNPYYYLYNYVMVIYAVVQANGSTYAIPRQLVAERIGVTTTLLLTLVAFKLVMAANVPRIPYQTYLDYYNIIAILALSTWVIENFIVSTRLYPDLDDPFPDELDFLFGLGWNAIWIVFHIVIVAGTIWGWFQHGWETVDRKERQLMKEQKRFDANLSDQGALNIAVGSFARGSSVRHMLLKPPEEKPVPPPLPAAASQPAVAKAAFVPPESTMPGYRPSDRRAAFQAATDMSKGEQRPGMAINVDDDDKDDKAAKGHHWVTDVLRAWGIVKGSATAWFVRLRANSPTAVSLAVTMLAFCGWALQLGAVSALTSLGCSGGKGEVAPFPELPPAAAGRRLLGEAHDRELEARCSFSLSMDW